MTLFHGLADFQTAQNRAIAIDAATGQVTDLPDEAAQRRFLNKQPDPMDTVIYANLGTSVPAYAGLSYLSHNLSSQSALSGQRITLGDVNQSDPGQYFLFGKAGKLPLESTSFTLQARYFCSHCQDHFGTAAGALIFDAAAANAQFEMTNDEISLTLPLHLFDDGLQADRDQAPLFHKDGALQTITDYHALGHFYGPEAQQTGLLFSLIQDDGIMTGAAIGHRP